MFFSTWMRRVRGFSLQTGSWPGKCSLLLRVQMKGALSRHTVLLLLQCNQLVFPKHVGTWRTITTHTSVDLAVWSLNTWGFLSARWQHYSTWGKEQKRQSLTVNEFLDLLKYFHYCWCICVRELGIFVFHLIHVRVLLESETQHSCYQDTRVHIQLEHLVCTGVSSAETALHQWHCLSASHVASRHQAWDSFWINNLSCLWGHCHVMLLPEQKHNHAEKQLLNLGWWQNHGTLKQLQSKNWLWTSQPRWSKAAAVIFWWESEFIENRVPLILMGGPCLNFLLPFPFSSSTELELMCKVLILLGTTVGNPLLTLISHLIFLCSVSQSPRQWSCWQ